MTTPIDNFQKLFTAVDEYANAFQNIAAYKNTDLTPDGYQRELDRQRTVAKTKATTIADGIAASFSSDAEKAAAQAEPFRPKFNPDDLAQLSRTADAWQFNILPQLEAGKPWNQIIPTIGYDDAIAIERFAPTYVRSSAKQSVDASETLALIGQGIWYRHAALATSVEGREAILGADAAAHNAQVAASVAAEVRNARNVSGLTTARITLRNVLAPVNQS